MSESTVSTYFGKEHATAYDERATNLAPVRNALDFLMRMILLDLPSEARILCVGAGTGHELIHLASAFPGWRFAVVEPSPSMMEICREKARKTGVDSRCEFHVGFLDTLPSGAKFDAATSILVSQFLVDPDERRNYFHQIAGRLRPGAYLINADLASSLDTGSFRNLFEIWWRAHTGSGAESKAPSETGWGKAVAVSQPKEIESMMESAGFVSPICFYQALFIHAWYARVPTTASPDS